MTYSEKLRDSRWQKKRLEVLQREDFKCQWCKVVKTVIEGDHVQVHHGYYEYKLNPWEYNSESLFCLCANHHAQAQFEMRYLRRLIGHIPPHLVKSVVWFAEFLALFGAEKEPNKKVLALAKSLFKKMHRCIRFKKLAQKDRFATVENLIP